MNIYFKMLFKLLKLCKDVEKLLRITVKYGEGPVRMWAFSFSNDPMTLFVYRVMAPLK